MIQDLSPKTFYNHYQEQAPAPEDVLLLYRGAALFCRKDESGRLALPAVSEFSDCPPVRYAFSIDDVRFFLAERDPAVLPAGYNFVPVGELRRSHPQDLRYAAVTGRQLFEWYASNRFCGRCAAPLVHDQRERMLRCPDCGNMVFPRINPGVIVAVTDGDRLLLTRYAGRPDSVNYALVAGFTELGETPEETVAREVLEEVGLHVTDITYYKTQPWAFSSSLLMGFFCRVQGSPAVTLDEEELSLAQWFPRSEIPVQDDGVALTREMIRIFAEGRDPFSVK